MKITVSRNFEKCLGVVVLSAIMLIFSSCGAKNGAGLDEETRSDPSASAIEFSAPQHTLEPERTVKKDVYLGTENVGGLRESEVLTRLLGLAAKTDVEAMDATLNGNTWKVTRGKIGKKVNVEKTLEALLNSQEGKKVPPVVEKVVPPVTPQRLAKNIKVIGNYTTPLLDRSSSRVNNIDLAVEKLDYRIIPPGGEFSFNKVVGRRTEAKGYEDAPIIIMTKKGPKRDIAIGGGICQVSTTLYNALEECRINILERHLHSKDVGYVPKGEDATVNYGSADFKFRNNRSYPIMIRTYLKSRSLTIKILENRNT